MKHDYWFFMSYARRDAKDGVADPWLKRFYERLAREFAKVAGLSSTLKESDIGFIDEEGIEVGEKWDDKVAEALQSSKSFLCLYSPSYFNSEMCGKEFSIFDLRQNEYKTKHNKQPDLIIPVLWERPARLPRPLPEAVAKLQYLHASYPSLYSEEGVSLLLRTKEDKVYEKFVSELAEKLYAAVQSHTLPRLQNMPLFASVANAFRQPVEQVTLEPTIPGSLPPKVSMPEAVGPDVAWFVYLVGRDEDYKAIRKKNDCYGPRGWLDWRPYLPEDETNMGLFAHGIATTKKFVPFSVLPNDQLLKHLREAEDKNTIVIMIVDPWSVRLPVYKEAMTDYDENKLSNSEVVIVWNKKDSETISDETLRNEIRQAFYRSAEVAGFHDSVCSVDELQKHLGDAIDSIQKKIMRRMSIFRPTPTRSSLPTLNVPTGSPA